MPVTGADLAILSQLLFAYTMLNKSLEAVHDMHIGHAENSMSQFESVPVF